MKWQSVFVESLMSRKESSRFLMGKNALVDLFEGNLSTICRDR